MSSPKRTSIDRELARFVKYAYAHAPAVKQIFDAAGIKPADIVTTADLERVPVTPKDNLITLQRAAPPFGGFLATGSKRLKHIYLSPGPLFEAHGADTTLDRVAAQIFRAAGFKRGQIALNTLSYHLSPGGWLIDGGLQRAGVCVVPGGVGNTELQVKTMLDLKIQGYAGTPSFLMTLIKKAEELGLDFKRDFALRHALFTAEPYPASLREQFEGVYGLKTTNAYATGELGFLAYECEEKAGLHLAEGVIIELVDAATGKRVGPRTPGEIVVTTFNKTYPIIRLGTGDLAAYTDEPCACGRTSHRLTGLLGRVGDAIKVRGMFVHPNQLKMAQARFPEIVRMRGIITRSGVRDEFRLEVELADQAVNRPTLEQALKASVRELCRIGVDQVSAVLAGTLPADGKMLVDERTWD
jgi:phenylacetate-CoA ligase